MIAVRPFTNDVDHLHLTVASVDICCIQLYKKNITAELHIIYSAMELSTILTVEHYTLIKPIERSGVKHSVGKVLKHVSPTSKYQFSLWQEKQ